MYIRYIYDNIYLIAYGKGGHLDGEAKKGKRGKANKHVHFFRSRQEREREKGMRGREALERNLSLGGNLISRYVTNKSGK